MSFTTWANAPPDPETMNYYTAVEWFERLARRLDEDDIQKALSRARRRKTDALATTEGPRLIPRT